MSNFRFLHAADLHLGSPLLGLSLKDERVARRFAEASRDALSDLVERAIEAGVAFVLIAGDVYDGEWKDASTGLFFAQQMSRLARADIPVFLIKGNHDADSVVTSNIPLPANVSTLSSRSVETKRLDALRVAIHGRSFPHREVTENWASTYPQAEKGWFNIGMLHTSCDGREGHASYAPCAPQDLVARGYDYWALGHVHEYEEISRDPWIVYPGNLQGRSIRECGAKGAVLVTVEDRRVVDVSRMIVDRARWHEIHLDVSSLEGEAALDAAMEAAFEPLAQEAGDRLVAARLRLVGRSALHNRLAAKRDEIFASAQAAAQRCAEDIWIEKLALETRAADEAVSSDLAGLDLGALLASLDAAALREEGEKWAGELRGKTPSGASLQPTLDNLDALVEEARAMLLFRATGEG